LLKFNKEEFPSFVVVRQEKSSDIQPDVKIIPFHAECVIIANQPFPLIHVLKLKKNDGITNNQFAYARLWISSVWVLKICIITHTIPPIKITK
jgi:hypothetical protein